MRAVVFAGQGRADVVERPRPRVVEPDDAVVMVTTAGIALWDIERFAAGTAGGGSDGTVPGGEFAGNIVELGPAVKGLKINDLVFTLSGWKEPDGATRVFGLAGLDGGHADYVRVPRADRVLVKTTAGAEERSALAGGSLALGASAAEFAAARYRGGRVTVVGCDPLGMAALAWMKGRGLFAEVVAVDDHAARLALARRYGAATVDAGVVTAVRDVAPADVVIVGSLHESPGAAWVARAVKAGSAVVFTDPDGVARWRALGVPLPQGVTLEAVEWPSKQFAERVAVQLAVRKLDAAGMVSHVMPLDLAPEAYAQASGRGPGVQKVLLKP